MIREYRTVEEIVSPLMMVRMVENVTYDELVEVELQDGSIRRGQVLEVNGDTCLLYTSPGRRRRRLLHAMRPRLKWRPRS